MALKDILQAITDEADSRIAEAQAVHKKKVKEMKDAGEKTLTDSLTRIRHQKDQKKHQMRARAESHAHMLSRHAILRSKQEFLDELYDGVADALAAQPKDKLEAFLKKCMDQIEGEGTIHAAKPHEAIVKKLAGSKFAVGESIDAKGGFRFVGVRQDRDYTLEFLVHHVLRPETEIAVAKQLFPSAK